MNTVTILVDQRAPGEAKESLAGIGHVLEVKSDNIVYPAISGHPDIFFCQSEKRLFHAPNTPGDLLEKLRENDVKLIPGEEPLGNEYPATARYNAVATPYYLVHNFRYSDLGITNNLPDLEPIHVGQGYTRCNLLPLGTDAFITSDEGIRRSLTGLGFEVMMTDPKSISLPGTAHGFFGGACGLWHDRIFIMGKLETYPRGKEVADFMRSYGYHITELYDGPLIDTGSILFIES